MKLTYKALSLIITLCCSTYTSANLTLEKSMQLSIEQRIGDNIFQYLGNKNFIVITQVDINVGKQDNSSDNIVDIDQLSLPGLPSTGPINLSKKKQQHSNVSINNITVDLFLDTQASTKQLNDIKKIVKLSMGYNAQRGDKLNITRKTFYKPSFTDSLYKNLDVILLYLIGFILLLALFLILIMTWFVLKKKLQSQYAPIEQEISDIDTASPEKDTKHNKHYPAENIHLSYQQLSQIITQEIILKPENVVMNLLKYLQQPNPQYAVLHTFRKLVGSKVFDNLLGNDLTETQIQQIESTMPATQTQENKYLENICQDLFMNNIKDSVYNEQHENPLKVLQSLNTKQLTFILQDETIETQALALSTLDQAKAAQIVTQIDNVDLNKLLIQISNITTISSAERENVFKQLKTKIETVPQMDEKNIDNTKLITDIISALPNEAEESTLAYIKSNSAGLYNKINNIYTTFEELITLDVWQLKKIIRAVPTEMIATALHGADKKISTAILDAMSQRNKQIIQSQIVSTSTPTAQKVNNARRKIAAIASEIRYKEMQLSNQE